MIRKLGGFVSILAALLCIGVVGLWVRSRQHADVLLVRTTQNHLAGAALVKGGVLVATSDLPFDCSVSVKGEEMPVALHPLSIGDFQKYNDGLIDPISTVKFSLLGFKTAVGKAAISTTLSTRFSAMVIPYWLLVTITGLVALRGLRSIWIHHRRVRKGLCLGCGYDTRASTGRCPECGKAIEAPRTPSRA
jgi:hypothetical protein